MMVEVDSKFDLSLIENIITVNDSAHLSCERLNQTIIFSVATARSGLASMETKDSSRYKKI